MKRFLLCTALLTALIPGWLHAQLFNPGFENLNSNGTCSNWGNNYIFSVFIDSSGVVTGDSIVFDNQFYAATTDAHSGSYALELRNAYNFTTNEGIAGSVSADEDSIFTSWGTFEQVAISGYPVDFGFFHKYFPANGDTGLAILLVFDAMGDEIGRAEILISGTVPVYTYLSAPVVYTVNALPAAYTLNFSTANVYVEPSFGTRLLIDDVILNVSPTSLPEDVNGNDIDVFPNPANQSFTISQQEQVLQAYTISDISGRIIGNYQMFGKSIVHDTADLKNGVYFLTFTNNGTSEYKKIVISKQD